MKRYIILLFFACQSISGGLSAQITNSFHHFVKATFEDPQNVHVDPSSQMYQGTIDRDTMRFKYVLENVDAEIAYIVEAANVSDEILFGLVDNSNEAMYKIRLSGGAYYVEFDGASLFGGTYSIGDTLIVQRCGTAIFYYYEGVLKKTIFLEDSDFRMDGKVLVVSASASQAEIEYRLL